MSTLEKKALAFEKLAALHSEAAIDDILALLETLNGEVKDRVLNLSQHYDKVKEQYGDVLQKLAQ